MTKEKNYNQETGMR